MLLLGEAVGLTRPGSTTPQYADLACNLVSKSNGASLRVTGKVSSQVLSSARPHRVTEVISDE